jgi:hypothetical protein
MDLTGKPFLDGYSFGAPTTIKKLETARALGTETIIR